MAKIYMPPKNMEICLVALVLIRFVSVCVQLTHNSLLRLLCRYAAYSAAHKLTCALEMFVFVLSVHVRAGPMFD